MDLTFKTPEGRFNHRTAGLLIHDGKILVMKDERSPYFYLPSGRIALHETSEEAILREIREELETEVTVDRLIWIIESYFQERVSGEKFHEMAFYYQLSPSADLLAKGKVFHQYEGGKHDLTFRWVPLDEMKNLDFQPAFLKERFAALPEHIEHIVKHE